MAILRIECPECGAGLKSPTGFAAGQSVACPKCETYFTVEEPEDNLPAKPKKAVKAVSSRDDDDDEEGEKPKKKKKKKSRDDDDDDDDGKSYKTSPMRFIVLGILVVIMVVLGIMLVMKKMDEKKQNEGANAGPNEDAPANLIVPQGGQGQPPLQVQGFGGAAIGAPKNAIIIPKKGGGFPPPPVGVDPIAGLVGQSPRVGTDESVKLQETHRKKLLGMWEGTAADGSLHKIGYQDNGQFTHEISGGGKGSTSAGTWNISGLVGTRGVKINRGTVTLKVVFEGDELLHDTATPGETVVLRKK